MDSISIGSDPEFVLMRNGKAVSAPNALRVPKGTHVPKVKTRFGEIFPDNANLEFSVNYGKSKSEFIENLRGCISIAQELVGPEVSIHAIPSLEYSIEELRHPICRKFGCEPDYDAFKLIQNEISSSAIHKPFRTCGGHVHIGNLKGHDYLQDPMGKVNTVKNFELIVGIPSLLLDHTKESLARRALYGGTGAHRPKSYGVECRSLSNYWTQNQELAEFIYDATTLVVKEMDETNLHLALDKLPDIINNGKLPEAKQIFKEVTNTYPELQALYEKVEGYANLDKSIPLNQSWKL